MSALLLCAVDSSLFWIGMLPVVTFVLLITVTTRRIALWAALISALIVPLAAWLWWGSVDELTLITLGMILIAVLLSLKTDNEVYFKLQPAVGGSIFAIVLFVFYFVLDRPLLSTMFDRYFAATYEKTLRGKISVYVFKEYLAVLSLDLIFGFIVHAGLVAFAAFRMTRWWWLAIRIPGLYLMLCLASFTASRALRTHMQ